MLVLRIGDRAASGGAFRVRALRLCADYELGVSFFQAREGRATSETAEEVGRDTHRGQAPPHSTGALTPRFAFRCCTSLVGTKQTGTEKEGKEGLRFYCFFMPSETWFTVPLFVSVPKASKV